MLIPEAHRSLVDYVELRKQGQVPKQGGGSVRGAGIIRLSYACLRKNYNANYCSTLLHETGHHVDYNYRVEAFARSSGADGAALLNTRHEGATPGGSERIADCYMIYMLQMVANVHYSHPADPAAYRGTEATRRFRVLVQSKAFEGISNYPVP